MTNLGPPPPRSHWALEQAERHLGRTLEVSNTLPLEGRLANPSDPELWVFRGIRDPRRFLTVVYAVEADAAFLAYATAPDAGVFEKWVNGEKVDERSYGPGESVPIPWEKESVSHVSP